MAVPDETRVALRRTLHRLKEELASMELELAAGDPVAASGAVEARNAVLRAWAILATPIVDGED